MEKDKISVITVDITGSRTTESLLVIDKSTLLAILPIL